METQQSTRTSINILRILLTTNKHNNDFTHFIERQRNYVLVPTFHLHRSSSSDK